MVRAENYGSIFSIIYIKLVGLKNIILIGNDQDSLLENFSNWTISRLNFNKLKFNLDIVQLIERNLDNCYLSFVALQSNIQVVSRKVKNNRNKTEKS